MGTLNHLQYKGDYFIGYFLKKAIEYTKIEEEMQYVFLKALSIFP